MSQKVALIILAGGTGVRYASKTPKQFTVVSDSTPVFIHATLPFLKACKRNLESIVVVCPPEYMVHAERELKARIKTKVSVQVIPGGKRRIDSLFLAIRFLIENNSSADIVLAHDAVRPLINPSDVIELIEFFNAEKLDAGVIVKTLSESLYKKGKGMKISCLNREEYVLGETPNIFTFPVLKKIYTKWSKKIVSSHTALDIMELIDREKKYKVGGYEGKHLNVKLTYPYDIHVIKQYVTKNVSHASKN